MKQIICGAAGFVGTELAKLFYKARSNDVNLYDIKGGYLYHKNTNFDIDVAYSEIYNKIPNDNYEICHIAVPTPMSPDGSADISAIEDVLQKIKADLYIIHSTIPPGTTDMLEGKYKKNIIQQPEYVASDSIYPAPLGDMRKMPFIILGGRESETKKARRLYEKVYPPTVEIMETDAKTAEIIKYAENCFIATKVTFCSEIFKICNAYNSNYDTVRHGVFRCDPRMTEWWTLSEGKGYKSKCLDKDIPAIIHASEKAGYNPEFLKSVVENNRRFKNAR